MLKRGVGRWSPSATSAVKSHIYVSKRFNETGASEFMPFPFDKYKMPGAAKKWLAKYPNNSNNVYEEEFVYLDEIEDRISDHFKKQRQSPKYREALNEFGVIGDYDDVDKVYPPIDTKNLTWGRGNKINPSHYVNAQFLETDRVHFVNDKIVPRHLLRNAGTLGNAQGVPPESPSLFKFWNFWHMMGAAFIITVGKEWLILSSHDTHHYMMWFLVWGWFSGLGCDLFLWWKCLRGQEYYDQRFFPLQENVDNLFTLLDRLEKKPNMGLVLTKYHGYLEKMRERLVTKRVAESIASKGNSISEILEQKFRTEQSEADKPAKLWKAAAMTETLAFFENQAQLKTYTSNAMAALKKDGGAKFGVAKNSSTVLEDKYAELLKKQEETWNTEMRKAGTLPWTFATDAEKKAAAMSEADKKALYDSIIKDLSSKYHAFA